MTTDSSNLPQKPLDEEAIRKSIVEPQPGALQQPGIMDALGLDASTGLFFLASKADGVVPWGHAPTFRDRQLRQLLPLEPYTLSAIATIIATNMGLSWVLDGPTGTVSRAQDVLHTAQFGEGWEAFIGKFSLDFYTQDKGAFAELVRDANDWRAPVIGINALDAGRCWHTGNPLVPVIYQDRRGRWHALEWWQVITATEMPASHELLYGLQYCALTRILGITQILRNTITLLEEKTGGRHTRTVHIVSGVKEGAITAAMTMAQKNADDQGLLRYIQPVIVTGVDPENPPTLTSIALADLPDNFSEHLDDWFKWFLVAISMGLLRDYQDFAPLPGGGLGTSAQSQILHLKTRGKGPAIFQKKIEHAFNFRGVVPQNVTFRFDEHDLEEESARSELFDKYARGYSALMSAGALDAQAVQQLMVDNEMIPQELFDELQKRDITGPPPVSDAIPAASDRANRPGDQRANDQDSALGQRGMTYEFDEERVLVEDGLTAKAQTALRSMAEAIAKRINAAA